MEWTSSITWIDGHLCLWGDNLLGEDNCKVKSAEWESSGCLDSAGCKINACWLLVSRTYCTSICQYKIWWAAIFCNTLMYIYIYR